MTDRLTNLLDGKRILIVGMGREGRSSLRFIEDHCKSAVVGIADRNPASLKDASPRYTLYPGEKYPGPAEQYDLVMVSPGIERETVEKIKQTGVMVSSQTGLFLRSHAGITTGITGTKGKSTTSSLLHHLFTRAGKESYLVGNIGHPAFDIAGMITSRSRVVYELSSSQLETIKVSSHTGILLNLFPEHLDRYLSAEEYFVVKSRLILEQKPGDVVIIPAGNGRIEKIVEQVQDDREIYRFSAEGEVERGAYIEGKKMKFRDHNAEVILHDDISELHLKGRHNLLNIMAASVAAVVSGADTGALEGPITEFHGLEHRLEFAGEHRGILFYNDSISTIPESCIRALESVENVDTLLLGGFDRGLDYSELYGYLSSAGVRTLIFMGPAGKRMAVEYRDMAGEDQQLIEVARLENAFPHIFEHTRKNRACLLSPAAASYDQFRNFEERGSLYKKLAGNASAPC